MIGKAELLRWVNTLSEESCIGINGGWLCLCEVGPGDQVTAPYIEVGGVPEEEEEDEARESDAYARFEAAETRWDRIASGWCPQCSSAQSSVDEQYSFGAYAGIMCAACAIRGYTDGCGHLDGRQGSAADLDEPMNED